MTPISVESITHQESEVFFDIRVVPCLIIKQNVCSSRQQLWDVTLIKDQLGWSDIFTSRVPDSPGPVMNQGVLPLSLSGKLLTL